MVLMKYLDFKYVDKETRGGAELRPAMLRDLTVTSLSYREFNLNPAVQSTTGSPRVIAGRLISSAVSNRQA